MEFEKNYDRFLAFSENDSITSLDLSANDLAASTIESLLTYNTTITEINLDANYLQIRRPYDSSYPELILFSESQSLNSEAGKKIQTFIARNKAILKQKQDQAEIKSVATILTTEHADSKSYLARLPLDLFLETSKHAASNVTNNPQLESEVTDLIKTTVKNENERIEAEKKSTEKTEKEISLLFAQTRRKLYSHFANSQLNKNTNEDEDAEIFVPLSAKKN